MMRIIYRYAMGHRPPLSGAAPGQADEIAAWWKRESERGLADLRHDWGPGG
jgi:hypothetical protein